MDKITSVQIINPSHLDELNLGHVVPEPPLSRMVTFFHFTKICECSRTSIYYAESLGYFVIVHGTSYSCKDQQK